MTRILPALLVSAGALSPLALATLHDGGAQDPDDQARAADEAALAAKIDALRASLDARSAAVDAVHLPWIGTKIDRADQLRWEGLRLLNDALGPAQQQDAQQWMQDSLALNQAAQHDVALLEETHRLLRDTLHELPEYLTWRSRLKSYRNFGPRPAQDIRGLF